MISGLCAISGAAIKESCVDTPKRMFHIADILKSV